MCYACGIKQEKIRIMKTLICPFLCLLCISAAHGQTWISQKNGQWNDPGVWSVTGGSGIPPATLTSGMTVTIKDWINWPNSFSSNLEIRAGGQLNINNGILSVGTGVSMKNYGNFFGNNGKLAQCVFENCAGSGAPSSGNWTTMEGGYTRMINMEIEIAGDWVSSSNGKRILSNTCLKTGQNFTVSGAASEDTLVNTTIILGLHGSGNFQSSDARIVFDNARIWLKSIGSGNIELNSGTISGNITALKSNAAGSSIMVSPSVNGFAALLYYCLADITKFIDPGNKLQGENFECDNAFLLTASCDNLVILGTKKEAAVGKKVTAPGLRLLHHPYSEIFSFQYVATRNGLVRLHVYSSSGALLYGNTLYCTQGANIFRLPQIVTQAKGWYLVELTNLMNERTVAKAIN